MEKPYGNSATEADALDRALHSLVREDAVAVRDKLAWRLMDDVTAELSRAHMQEYPLGAR